MHGLGQTRAHHAGRRQRAVEPGQRHHVENGAHALAFAAEQEAECIAELNLGRRVGAVADLVLQPLQPQAVEAAVLKDAGHQKTAQLVARFPAALGQHDKGVGHRRGQEPFVPREPVDALAGACRLALIGADIGAALLLRHAHADDDAGFLHGRAMARIIAARHYLRRPSLFDARRGHDGGNRRIGHGQRAQMTAFKAGGEEKPDRAGLMGEARFLAAAFPDRALQPARHAAAHQGVPARMEIDLVDAVAKSVMGLELGDGAVGDAGKVLRVRRRHEFSDSFKIIAKPARHVGRDVLQQRIGAIGIVPGKWRALIVGLLAEGLNWAHATSLTGIRAVLHGDIAYFRHWRACPCPGTFL